MLNNFNNFNKNEKNEKNEKIKIALFDFCETIVNFQSADAYVNYALKRVKRSLKARFYEFLRKFLIKTHLINYAQKILFFIEGNINKKLLLKQLAGASKNQLEELAENFYKEVVRPNYILEIINEIKRLKADNFNLFIVSGGYDIYIKRVAKEFNFDGVICTELYFKNNIFTGRYKNCDCMGKNKIKFLKKFFGRDNLKNFDSIAYSDSPSDLPLFNYCKRATAVYPDIPKWIRDFKNNNKNLEGFVYHA